MSYRFLSNHSSKLFDLIKEQNAISATKQSTAYFKNNHTLGSRDRKIIAHIAFYHLRNKELIKYIHKLLINKDLKLNPLIIPMFLSINNWQDFTLPTTIDCSKYISPNLLKAFKINSDQIKEEHPELESSIIQILKNIQSKLHKLSENSDTIGNNELKFICQVCSIPHFFSNQINLKNFSNEQIILLLQSLNKPAPLSLRTNTYLSSREEIITEFKGKVHFSKGKLSPTALTSKIKINVSGSESFKNGHFEIQDESSQMLAYSIEPKDDSIILDACAGAGGKTLHLAGMYPNCQIWASDKNKKKLKELSLRAKRAKLENIIIVDDIVKLTEKENYFDYLIIDSPCSGSGTVRRSPELKYRIDKLTLKKYNSLQRKIIGQYIPLLKVEGELIYSTCSIFKSENEDISDWIINNLNFKSLSLPEIFNKIEQFASTKNPHKVSILPVQFSSDGFFISRHKKVKINS
jgi:16S rRNA (cytosine(967)-C(5))-methyltransferase